MRQHDRPRFAAAIAATLTALVLAACNATPAASIITDPKLLLTTALGNAAAAKGVHVDVTASGQLPVDLTGSASMTGGGLDLTGTTASADIDLTAPAAHATFAAPGVLGLRGDLIAIDDTVYYKTTLTGPLYQHQSTGASATPSSAPSAAPSGAASAANMIAELQTFLDQPGVDPVKGADVACGNATCSTVQIELTPEELAALGSSQGAELPTASLPIAMPDLSSTGVDLTFRVEQATNRLAGLTIVVEQAAGASAGPAASASGVSGPMTVDLTFSKWDESVTVTAPPAGQVAP
jgi:hypothetical protein